MGQQYVVTNILNQLGLQNICIILAIKKTGYSKHTHVWNNIAFSTHDTHFTTGMLMLHYKMMFAITEFKLRKKEKEIKLRERYFDFPPSNLVP